MPASGQPARFVARSRREKQHAQPAGQQRQVEAGGPSRQSQSSPSAAGIASSGEIPFASLKPAPSSAKHLFAKAAAWRWRFDGPLPAQRCCALLDQADIARVEQRQRDETRREAADQQPPWARGLPAEPPQRQPGQQQHQYRDNDAGVAEEDDQQQQPTNQRGSPAPGLRRAQHQEQQQRQQQALPKDVGELADRERAQQRRDGDIERGPQQRRAPAQADIAQQQPDQRRRATFQQRVAALDQPACSCRSLSISRRSGASTRYCAGG